MNVIRLIHIDYPDHDGLTDEQWLAEIDRRIAEHNPRKGDRVYLGDKSFVFEYPDFYLLKPSREWALRALWR